MATKQANVRIEITNASRLHQTGRETELLYVGDVLELDSRIALDLVGNGKAVKTNRPIGRHGRDKAAAAEKAAQAQKPADKP